MEDVDGMIVDLLVNDLHCSFASKALRLCDFGAEQIVEGIIRCIWRCRPGTVDAFPTFQLPNNPIERFRFASKISQEIQAVGVRGQQQIGYQALLYPNVFDSRHIFLALFAHFPKETVGRSSADETTLSQMDKLKTNVGALIADQLKSKWTPEFCHFYGLQRVGRLWFPSSVTDGGIDQQQMFANKMAGERRGESDVWTTVACTEQRKIVKPTTQPPKIAPKPKITAATISSRPVSSTISCEETPPQNDGHEQIHFVQEKIEQKFSALTQKRRALAACRHANALLAEQIAARQHRIGDDERLAQLVDTPEESRQKLEHYIACSDERRLTLEQKYAEAERERFLRLDQLNGIGNGRDDGGQCSATGADTKQHPLVDDAVVKIADLNGIIATLEQQLEKRRHIRQKLLRECQKAGENFLGTVKQGKGNARVDYVHRILEMSAMVGKQNEEIRKTAKSVQSLRKEIEQLLGSLERTFIAVDRWLSKNVEGNARMQRAYKLMVRTHEQCALVMGCIEDQGQLGRYADELVDKIGVEQQKSVDEQLEKLLDDLMLINHENIELDKRISLLSSAEHVDAINK